MKRLLFTTIALQLLLVLLMCGSAFGTDYYVTQSGAGGKDGKAIGSAWAVSDFNDSGNWDSSENADKIDPGDTVYFSGAVDTSSTEITLQGSGTSGNEIILDGYETGAYDVVANSGAHASFADIDCGDGTSGNGINLNKQSYIKIRNFHINDCDIGISGAYVDSTSIYIYIEQNEIESFCDAAIRMQKDSGTANEDNYWYIGSSSTTGNYIHTDLDEDTDCSGGEQNHIVMDQDVNNIYIGYNEIFCDSSAVDKSQGITSAGNASVSGGSVVDVSKLLIEYNYIHDFYVPTGFTDGFGIALKAAKEFIIRFNRIEDCEGAGIAVDDSSYTGFIYGNYVSYPEDDSKRSGIRLYDDSTYKQGLSDIHVWSNIIEDTGFAGLAVSGISYAVGEHGGLYFYNNTLSNCNQLDPTSDAEKYMVAFNASSTSQPIYLKNNIVAEGGFDEKVAFFYGTSAAEYVIDYNLWYDAGGASIRYTSSWLTPTQCAAVTGTNFANFVESDPLFTNEGTSDFTLQATSPAKDTGVDLSGSPGSVTIQGTPYVLYYDDVLDPDNTDWTTTPPTVVVGKQDDYAPWEKGAYFFTPAGNQAPNGVIDAPASNQTINEGETVNFTCTGTDPDADSMTYAWDFDGSSPTATSALEDPGNVTFDDAGVFTCTLTVTDEHALADPTPASVVVTVGGAGAITDSSRDLPTAYISKTYGAGAEDYATLNGWEEATDLADLTAVTTVASESTGTTLNVTDGTPLDDGKGFEDGDTLVVDPDGAGAGPETVTVASRVDNVITLDAPGLTGTYTNEDIACGFVLKCSAAAYADKDTIDGAGTTAAFYRVIMPVSGAGHSGIPKSDGSCVEFHGNVSGFVLAEKNAQLHDLVLKFALNSASTDYCVYLQEDETKLVGCLIYDSQNVGAGTGNGVYINRANVNDTMYIINCLIHNCDRTAVYANIIDDLRIYNTTENGSGVASLYNSANGIVNSTNCIWDTTIDDDQGGTHNQTTNITDTPTYVNSGSDDFHLASGDTTAKDQGTDLSGDVTFAFDDDIDADANRAGSWDIGFDEYVPGPEVTNIYTDQADGYYNDEDTIDYTYVVFSENVGVTGTPQLTLETGATDVVVNYVSGTGTQILKFAQWSVEADDSHTSSDLDAKSLALNGGTVVSAATGKAAVLTLITGATAGSLASNHAIVIDTTADTQTSWTGVTTDASSFTSASDTIDILLTLPDANGYNVTAFPGWPKIQALIAYPAITTYAYYLHQVTATTFLFRIYLGADYRTTGLTLTGNLLTSGGSFLDQAGNAISATYPSLPNRLQDDKTYVIAVPSTFTVTSINTPGTYDHWVPGDDLTFITTTDEAIDTAVSGTSPLIIGLHIKTPIMTALTDNWTIDEDWWDIEGHRRIYNGTMTVDGSNNTVIGFSAASTGTGPAGFNTWMPYPFFLED